MYRTSNFTAGPVTDPDKGPDHLYYNCTIINNRTQSYGTVRDPQVRFQDTRDTALISDASDYNFSVIRFICDGPGKDLPLMLPVIRTGESNPGNDVNLTIYSVSLKVTVTYTVGPTTATQTFQTTQPIIYIPETQDPFLAPTPDPSSCQLGQIVTTRYYWVYTYSHFLDLVNNAFTAGVSDLNTQFNAWYLATFAVAGPNLKMTAPYLTYNPANNLFSIYADCYAFGGADRKSAGSAADENARIFMNNNCFGLFAGFNNIYYNTPDELTNEIIIKNILYQNIITTTTPPAGSTKPGPATDISYWNIVQDYESTSTLWSPVENITFVSTLLPLVFEQSGDPVRFGEGNDNFNGNSQGQFAPIITDVALPRQNAADYRGYIQYVPSGEYRIASFNRSKQPINNIDIQVFWRNRLTGQLQPLEMFNGSSVSVKIMFRRRGVSDYPHPAKIGYDV
jgi:hypothetical protein